MTRILKQGDGLWVSIDEQHQSLSQTRICRYSITKTQKESHSEIIQ